MAQFLVVFHYLLLVARFGRWWRRLCRRLRRSGLCGIGLCLWEIETEGECSERDGEGERRAPQRVHEREERECVRERKERERERGGRERDREKREREIQREREIHGYTHPPPLLAPLLRLPPPCFLQCRGWVAQSELH